MEHNGKRNDPPVIAGGLANAAKNGKPQKPSTLKRVFDQQAEETITEDQIDSVLAPVLAGIEEGRYGKRRRRRIVAWLAGPLPAMLAVAALIVFVALNMGDSARQDGLADIGEAEVPLAGMPADGGLAGAEEMNTITGKVYFADQEPAAGGDAQEGLAGAIIQLIIAESGEAYSWTITDEHGEFKLKGFPDGAYQLRVALPTEMGVAFAAEVVMDKGAGADAPVALLMVKGETDLLFGMSGSKTLEGVDIPVCRTK